MPKIIFVSGVHGVGKSTLCGKLSEKFRWSHYSCSDLIKENSDYVEGTKLVSSADKNQQALLIGLSQLTEEVVLLDGHFCLLNDEEQVIELPFEVFDAISPSAILLVTCEEETIHQRLKQRGGHVISLDKLAELQKHEILRSKHYSSQSNCKLFDYRSPNPCADLMSDLRTCV
ncbi:ATP-binding protein [Vibrio vulnificus]|uniref:ATP-binding protein n=1 Tax=Vibrio vulnificus TaxID=672 RepID=UPI0005F166B5|nr:ATP-binding protein [Vibrio vulnificus]EGQ9309959.1 AAA family ATPase [Vibrio vulnificus]EGQ9313796.1 AAA family ATPase [Vibrio vulnificus]EGR0393473.1 AAA family ATPase [Vibrio vulnificus]EGR0395233.1 AAA family ATPase [Vibrio vulnificus]EGR0669380.1 AAA family ATPase [Vibrio vulnificus]